MGDVDNFFTLVPNFSQVNVPCELFVKLNPNNSTVFNIQDSLFVTCIVIQVQHIVKCVLNRSYFVQITKETKEIVYKIKIETTKT